MEPLYFNKINSYCATCSPMCPTAAHAMGTYYYYRDTGTITALGDVGTHLMNYYNQCISPMVPSVGSSVKSVATSKVTSIAKRMLENSLGVG
jgi:hypothetical protein